MELRLKRTLVSSTFSEMTQSVFDECLGLVLIINYLMHDIL